MPNSLPQFEVDGRDWSRSLMRPLGRRYLLVLLSVAGLVLVDQAIVQPLLVQLNFSAPAINLAGRQRMLSQKISKEALALAILDEDHARERRRRELQTALDQWTAAHRALRQGDRELGIPAVSGSIGAALQEVEPDFTALRELAGQIALADVSTFRSESRRWATAILEHEPRYLRGMETVVGLLEDSARRRVAWLRGSGIAAMSAVLLLLIGVHFLVLRPAAELIRGQVEEVAASDARHRQLAGMLEEARNTLEQRVEQRTSELSEMNRALAGEIAEREAAESRMRELSIALAHASRVTALGQLATGLAHEINQPLATVANYAGTLEIALESASGEDDPRWLASQIKLAALRAGEIVRRMRNFVRRGQSQKSEIDLNDLAREVVELCGCEIRDGGARLQLELTPRPLLVAADSVQIQQVLVNLISNALQAMASAHPADRLLRIRTEGASGEALLIVADSGPGFPEADSAVCFQPFHSTRSDGLGLGLAISRDIIELHHGRIWSENGLGGGAVVGFSLPLETLHDHSRQQQPHCLCR